MPRERSCPIFSYTLRLPTLVPPRPPLPPTPRRVEDPTFWSRTSFFFPGPCFKRGLLMDPGPVFPPSLWSFFAPVRPWHFSPPLGRSVEGKGPVPLPLLVLELSCSSNLRFPLVDFFVRSGERGVAFLTAHCSVSNCFFSGDPDDPFPTNS